jgi:hypothetical protein
MSLRVMCDSLSPREKVGVREPGSTLEMASMGRFMERKVLQKLDTYWDHEPRGRGDYDYD